MASQPQTSPGVAEIRERRKPRVAGRNEGFDNTTTPPVVGRVAGRYDGFDTIAAPRDPALPATRASTAGAESSATSPETAPAPAGTAPKASSATPPAEASSVAAPAVAPAKASSTAVPRSAARRAAPPSAEQRANVLNYRATNQSARRKEDDTSAGQGAFLGVTGLLRNPRNRLYLATLVAATPFVMSFSFYVSQFSFSGQFIIGVLCGLCIQAVYMLYTMHRKHQRKSKVP